MQPRHGHAARRKQSKTYCAWWDMIRRCTRPYHKWFPSYGGRGITVCERWLKFDNFLADMGEAPAGLTLDRKDNSGNYEPGNCRWATPAEQMRNTRASRYIEAQGVRLVLRDWAARLGCAPKTIRDRIDKLGWSPEEAVSTPTKRGRG